MSADEIFNIPVPSSIDWSAALNYRVMLGTIGDYSAYRFDFSSLGHVEPFGMIVVAEAIQRFIDDRPDSKFEAIGCKSGYASHMGFYKACGFDYGNDPGQASGSDSYLPITKMSVASIKKAAGQKGRLIGDEVEEIAKTQAELLARSPSSELFNTFSYCLRELIRNVVEHSESEKLYFCAQYWPSRKEAELAILDCGVGILSSLTQNPAHQPASHKDALKISILPGVTRVTTAPGTYDVWANSGYGLYMTSRICQEGGRFLIASGDAGLELKGTDRDYYSTDLAGTAVQLFIKTDRNEKTQSMLGRFSKEGAAIAKLMSQSGADPAETASMMLDVYTKKKV